MDCEYLCIEKPTKVRRLGIKYWYIILVLIKIKMLINVADKFKSVKNFKICILF